MCQLTFFRHVGTVPPLPMRELLCIAQGHNSVPVGFDYYFAVLARFLL